MIISDDLDKLLTILPSFVRKPIDLHQYRADLIEIVMDLGKRPEARFPNGPEYLSYKIISWHDLDYCIKRVGHFSGDNRAGIEKTLHRISCIKNRQGNIIGLTCRVGRAILGTINLVRDMLEDGQSILLLGKPGVGKTTAIREIARILADEMEKRVVVIDTSNEIAGDGDIPHPAIGRARRMQVSRPELQHQAMIEAVENHMPEVIIIDEIGTELESLAARTIAERGVQLVGTAHGNYLNSLIKNPILSDLVGGIQYVTLGDDEAKRRGTQKSILERKAAPAFDVAIEIHSQNYWIVHEKVSETVDQILQGHQIYVQRRVIDFRGIINIQSEKVQLELNTDTNVNTTENHFKLQENNTKSLSSMHNSFIMPMNDIVHQKHTIPASVLSVYIYGINFKKVQDIATNFQIPINLCKKLSQANTILTLQSYIQDNSKLKYIARIKRLTIYTIHKSNLHQIRRALKRIFYIKSTKILKWSKLYEHKTLQELKILNEVKYAIEKVAISKKKPVELLPQNSSYRTMQIQIIKFFKLKSRSFGQEPLRRLRIYPNIN
jgi:stage III sporulation protein SpoIIIAA|uniref:R3H domain-containing protein n=1 Tax=Thorea hispida TaxID=202687 RepID=A0A1C9CA83_9FLOR|nr:hypothetical protein Thor_010 [Thorea hispida]AOM65302.1 hypothetical protein Thor_010 [Thorea hispida]UNJ79149.1 hypothetical protein [Thorea hispida]